MARIEKEVGAARFSSGNYSRAAKLFSEMSKSAQFAEFLTLPAYELID
jgi:malate synthase